MELTRNISLYRKRFGPSQAGLHPPWGFKLHFWALKIASYNMAQRAIFKATLRKRVPGFESTSKTCNIVEQSLLVALIIISCNILAVGVFCRNKAALKVVSSNMDSKSAFNGLLRTRLP